MESWFVTMSWIGPAPNEAGETDTLLLEISTVMTIGTGGRGLLA